VEELLAEKSEAERHAFYDRSWNTRRWRWMFGIFFSRFVMGRLGRDPEFFRYVEGSVADRILERTRYAFTVLPTHANPYLEYILTGAFRRSLPPYLAESTWEPLCANLDSLTLVPGTIAEAAARAGGRFDGFNLSDVFEYLDPETCRDTYAALLDAANPGARFAYWNMLVPRTCPEELAARVESHGERAAELFARDRAFFYRAFVLEEVR
jgi:S-adenosylmethionine-diacylglycerol 3-amino-3-carboxypropyl transferase